MTDLSEHACLPCDSEEELSVLAEHRRGLRRVACLPDEAEDGGADLAGGVVPIGVD